MSCDLKLPASQIEDILIELEKEGFVKEISNGSGDTDSS